MFKFIISRDVFGLTSALTFCHEHLRDLFILCQQALKMVTLNENSNTFVGLCSQKSVLIDYTRETEKMLPFYLERPRILSSG